MPFWNRKSKVKQLSEAVVDRDAQIVQMKEAFLSMADLIYDHPSFVGGTVFGGRDEWLGGNLAEIIEGKKDLLFMTESDLRAIRSVSCSIADSTPGIGMLSALTSYVMDTGWVYTIDAKDGVEVLESDVEEAQKFVDEFLEANDWECDLEEELFRRSERHGEFIVTLWRQTDGMTLLRTAEPHQLRAPSKSPPNDRSWTFGVDTRKEDSQSIDGYYIAFDEDQDPEYFDAEKVVHYKKNVEKSIKRGVSSFWFVYKELRKAGKVLNNTGASAAVQAAIAWIEKMGPGVKQAQVEDITQFSQTMSQALLSRANSSSSTNTVQDEPIEGGTVRRVENSRELEPSPVSSAASNLIAIADALSRYGGVVWNMPEYISSNNANNTVYASSLVAESPFVKKCKTIQKKTAKPFREIIYRALEWAAEKGRLGSIKPERVRDVFEVSIEYPEVAARDPEKETARRKILNEGGVLSEETWANQEDLNWKQEKDRGAKRKDPALTQFALQNPTSPHAKPTESPVELTKKGDLIFNGAQIQAATQIVAAVANGSLPRDAGINQLRLLFSLTLDQATGLMGSAGTTPNPTQATESRRWWEGYP